MRKISITLTLIFIMILTAAIPCHAASITDTRNINTEYEYYDNGSYAIINTTIIESDATEKLNSKNRKKK